MILINFCFHFAFFIFLVIMISGGQTTDADSTDTVEIYDPTLTRSCQITPSMPTTRFSPVAHGSLICGGWGGHAQDCIELRDGAWQTAHTLNQNRIMYNWIHTIPTHWSWWCSLQEQYLGQFQGSGHNGWTGSQQYNRDPQRWFHLRASLWNHCSTIVITINIFWIFPKTYFTLQVTPAASQITTRKPSSSQVESRHIRRWRDITTLVSYQDYQYWIKEDWLMPVVVTWRMTRRYFNYL